MRFAVIENEFGEIGVDQRILNERVNDEVIEGASQVTGHRTVGCFGPIYM